MTTVVVVRKGTEAAIAADTLTSFGDKRYPAAHKVQPDKIVRVGDSLVGIVGSPAHRQVLESLFSETPEAAAFTSRQAIFESFRALHPRLKEKYFLNPKEDDKDPYESSQIDMLIANRHGIFCLSTLRDVYEFPSYWAIGSGASFALGALSVLYGQPLDAREIAERAVAAACEFDKSSAAPVTAHAVALRSESVARS